MTDPIDVLKQLRDNLEKGMPLGSARTCPLCNYCEDAPKSKFESNCHVCFETFGGVLGFMNSITDGTDCMSAYFGWTFFSRYSGGLRGTDEAGFDADLLNYLNIILEDL